MAHQHHSVAFAIVPISLLLGKQLNSMQQEKKCVFPFFLLFFLYSIHHHISLLPFQTLRCHASNLLNEFSEKGEKKIKFDGFSIQWHIE